MHYETEHEIHTKPGQRKKDRDRYQIRADHFIVAFLVFLLSGLLVSKRVSLGTAFLYLCSFLFTLFSEC